MSVGVSASIQRDPAPRNLQCHRWGAEIPRVVEIADPYLRFHFTFLRPGNSLLEQNRIAPLMETIRRGFDAYVGLTGYEEACRRVLIKLGDSENLPFVPERVGRVWTRAAEFDVAAINHKLESVILGECKWTSKKIGFDVLENLERKSALFKRLNEYKITYALFCRSGFDRRLLSEAATRGVMLFHGLERIA